MRESQPRIIVIGSLQSAIEKLSNQLRAAGFPSVLKKPLSQVEPTKSRSHEVAIFLPGTPKEPRNRVAQKLRRQNPSLKIVMLYDHNISGTEVADAVINSNCDTEDLVRVLNYLTRKPARETATGA